MIGFFFSTLLLSLHDPRQGLRQIQALNRPGGTEMVALLLMAVASALLMQLSLQILPMPDGSPFTALFSTPFLTAGLQFLTLLLCAFLAWLVGGWFGGRGSFADAVLAIAWLQAVMLAIQLVQLLALVILPVLSSLIGIAAVGIFVVLLSNFIAEIHGFASPVKVFFGTVLTFLVSVFILTMILAPFIPSEYLPREL
ncbi:Yip1 family protein [Rhodobacter sp. 24-YEA-8]|uniref:Yip1 family protein n=1 Tax=Rhodobacter sp. 24-YEA-8 TaxID=1884310 RepID=UPI000897D46D|nr:Yip1 family protein [Rhodobacter sp. 24-YEA-8]SEB95900.1 Yip1 domain-containing protein [Rhodobacter sp. 24-YEA-8]